MARTEQISPFAGRMMNILMAGGDACFCPVVQRGGLYPFRPRRNFLLSITVPLSAWMSATDLWWRHKRGNKSSRFVKSRLPTKTWRHIPVPAYETSSFLFSRHIAGRCFLRICHISRLPPFPSSHIRIRRSFSFRWRRYFRDFDPTARTSLLFSAKISTPAGSIFPKILAAANPFTFECHRNENDRCEEKTHKKMSDKRVADGSVKLKLPQLSDPHK